MSKKLGYRVAAIVVCLAFLVCLTPALNGVQQSPIKPIKQASLMASLRLLGYLFPLLGSFTDLPQDSGKAVEKADNLNKTRMIAKSTDDQIANQPKTKD